MTLNSKHTTPSPLVESIQDEAKKVQKSAHLASCAREIGMGLHKGGVATFSAAKDIVNDRSAMKDWDAFVKHPEKVTPTKRNQLTQIVNNEQKLDASKFSSEERGFYYMQYSYYSQTLELNECLSHKGISLDIVTDGYLCVAPTAPQKGKTQSECKFFVR
jgi:hypothetical protein